MGKKLRFFAGALMGAAAGVGIGMLLAPRSGAESRAMAADAMNDAWDSAMDTYEQGAKTVKDTVNGFRPQVDVATDELRAKVDAARERMEQVRSSLSESVSSSAAQVADAVQAVSAQVGNAVDGMTAAETTEAADVTVEPVEAEDEPEAEAEPAE